MKIKNVFVIVVSLLLIRSAVYGQTQVTVSPNPDDQGVLIPEDFSGIAYEISGVPASKSGKYYFSPKNKALLTLVKTLGIKTIRIGGNTADLTTFKFPDTTDVDSLFLFAKAANIKINYTLRMNHGIIEQDAAIAKYIFDHYKANLQCLAIGNEPDLFEKSYDAYSAKWKLFRDAVLKVAPNVKFCGPNIALDNSEWPTKFLKEYGNTGQIKMITVHAYPGGSGSAVTDPAKAIDRMLSVGWVKGYERFYKHFNSIPQNGITYQNEEINSFYNGGARHVSDTYASSLWTLDFMYWWAAHQLGGINFQNGDSVAKGTVLTPCKYAAFVTATGGYYSRPSAYGIKAFDIGGHGRIVPTQIIAGDSINLTAYSVLNGKKRITFTIINKEHGINGKSAKITLAVDHGKYKKSRIMYLKSENGDVASESGVTLGNEPIENNGKWSGTWTSLKSDKASSHFVVDLPAATAVIIQLFN